MSWLGSSGRWHDCSRRRGRSLAVLQRAKRLLPPGPRKVPLGLGRGVRMHVDFSQTSRHYLGLYEIEVSRYIKTVCRPGAVCFDVGGSHGYDALVFAKLTGARVVTFEPVTTDLLRSNLALNPDLEPLVTV